MLQLKKLYTEPFYIQPIEFNSGVNFIVGEKDDSSSKNNGVGKSICVEFINFALLKNLNKNQSQSRLNSIPPDVFPPHTKICLSFTLNGRNVIIKRSIAEADKPTIIFDGVTTSFNNLSDAKNFLQEKLWVDSKSLGLNIRDLLSLLIRDERSEFKSLVDCFDTKLRIAPNYLPHLYLLGVDINSYLELKKINEELEEITDSIKTVNKLLLKNNKRKEDLRSDLNDLEYEVTSIAASIEQLENVTGFEILKKDLLELETQLDDLRQQQSILQLNLKKLQPIAKELKINTDELQRFYEQLKNGLGNLIVKELTEVISFKEKIETFQNHLLAEKRETLKKELKGIQEQILSLDEKYTKLLKVLDESGNLKNLKQTYNSYKAKSEEFNELKVLFNQESQLTLEKRNLESKKGENQSILENNILSLKDTIISFEKTILDIHEFIQGNRRASFELKQADKKQIIDIVMRIDADGSHSIEREKVFIYDLALMLNSFTKIQHLGLLIHDNIFEVDQDTLIKNLRYLLEKADFDQDQQYILTLNVDRLETLTNEEWFGLFKEKIVARLTKNDRFLKQPYQQTSRNLEPKKKKTVSLQIKN